MLSASITRAGIWREVLEFVRLPFPLLRVGRGRFFDRNIWPDFRVFRIQRQPFLKPRLGVGLDRVDRALRLAHPAINAFVRVDDEHVLALVEAVDGTYLYAVHVLTFDTAFIDDVGHHLLRVVGTSQTDGSPTPGRRYFADRRFAVPMFENQWSVPKLRDCYRPRRIGLDGTLLPTDRSGELIHGVRYRGSRSLAENGRRGDLRPRTGSGRRTVGIQGPRSSRLLDCGPSLHRGTRSPGKHRSADAPRSQLQWSALGACRGALRFARSRRASPRRAPGLRTDHGQALSYLCSSVAD